MATKKTVLISPTLLSGLDRFRRQFGQWQETTIGYAFTKIEEEAVKLDGVTNPLPLPPVSVAGDGFSDIITGAPSDDVPAGTEVAFARAQGVDRPAGSVSDLTGNPVPFNPYPTLLPTHKQTITLVDTRNPDTTTDKSWDDIINNLINTSAVYEDFVTSFNNPLTKEELLNVEGDVPSAPAAINYVYNYNDKIYESVLEGVEDHVIIPNLYSMFDASSRAGTDIADPTVDVDILQAPTAKTLRKNIRRRSERVNLQNKIVPIENMPLLANYEGSKYLFPMYVNINIPLDKNHHFAEVMKNSTLGIALTRDVEGVPDLASQLKTETVNFSTSLISRRTGMEETTNSTIPVKTIDLLQWSLVDAPSYAPEASTLYRTPRNFSFVGVDSGTFRDIGNFNSVATAIADNDAFAIALEGCYDGIKDAANDKRRNFEDLIGGIESYSEMLMYKVEKRLGPVQPVLQDPIQTFHFMNSAELEEFLSNERQFKFVDTQVKYNTQYIYTVTGYRVTIGTKYQYGNPNTNLRGIRAEYPNNRFATVDVFTTPVVKLIEVPMFSSLGSILDNPPLKPEIRFFPVVDDRSSIKMFFTTSTGIEITEPITFSRVEEEEMAQTQINQNRNDGKVTFKTDDSAQAFEIFRLTEPPVQIGDFSDALFATVPTESPGRFPLDGSSATGLVSQIPNQKYYYIFRTVDTHGHKSNPSPVYEIELYNDGGAGYPIIRPYDITSPDSTTTTKSARKIIQIVPRISQCFLNEVASNLINEDRELLSAKNKDLVLGVEDESLFGKKFKVRLTSKSTGKKLDLNINFKTKQLKSS